MTIDRLGIWIVDTALFALCCFLAAGLANAWIAEWLAASPGTAPVSKVSASQPARTWSDRQTILDRNLFQVSTLLPENPLQNGPELTAEELEATRLPLKLLGTVASTRRPPMRRSRISRTTRRSSCASPAPARQNHRPSHRAAPHRL
jgi:hypothetical protein